MVKRVFAGGSRSSRRNSRSGWWLVGTLILVVAAAIVAYAPNFDWQEFGQDDQVVGDRHAACLYAEGYRGGIASSDQNALNQQGIDACRSLSGR